jgi:hypothetical protein
MARAAFDVTEVVEFAGYLHGLADDADGNLEEAFGAWADETADIMRDEVPKDTWEMHDSITVERHGPLTARIGPTNVDDAGRPIGFFVNYGAGNRPPNDFIGRTADRAGEAAGAFTVEDLL